MSESLEENFRHIRSLAKNIKTLIGRNSAAEQKLANEVAGMFAVTIAATYEGIIRNTLISYASTIHPKYESHVEKQFKRLNSKISIKDLQEYSQLFGLPEWTEVGVKKNSTTFHKTLKEKRVIVERRFRKDLIVSYESLFQWRHGYAHERNSSATFKDVYDAHRVAQYVIRSFVKAFEAG
jgi:RiboL-PSP-HEPN